MRSVVAVSALSAAFVFGLAYSLGTLPEGLQAPAGQPFAASSLRCVSRRGIPWRQGIPRRRGTVETRAARRAMSGARDGGNMMPFGPGGPEEEGGLAPPQMIPLKPKSSLGVALRTTIEEDFQSFDWIQDEQIKWLSSEREGIRGLKTRRPASSASTKLMSKKQMQEQQKTKLVELHKMVVDLMYNMILYRFKALGIEPVRAGELDGPFADLGPIDLRQLTEGIHTQEALELVRSHLISVLGPMLPKSNQGFFTSAAKMPKLQLSQVYMTSVMFGYFLRRVDRRFQIAKKLDMLEIEFRSQEQSQSSYEYVTDDDYTWTYEDVTGEDPFSTTMEEEDEEVSVVDEEKGEGKPKVSLKEYIERFDAKTLMQCASLMSQEAAVLLQEYQYALFGNIRELQKQMAMAIGPVEQGGSPSPEQVMQRISQAVSQGNVETLVVTFADQRRLVLEAVALGGFLRDSEDYIKKRATSQILTPLPPLPMDDSQIRGMLNAGTE